MPLKASRLSHYDAGVAESLVSEGVSGAEVLWVALSDSLADIPLQEEFLRQTCTDHSSLI